MNPQWFGDSFDIVKRYFIENLKTIGYQVVVDPMLTGEWKGIEDRFYHFLGASPLGLISSEKTALLLDPDTGIGKKETAQHVTINSISSHLKNYEIVFSRERGQPLNRGLLLGKVSLWQDRYELNMKAQFIM